MIAFSFATDVPVDASIDASYIPVDANILPELTFGEILVCDGTCSYQKVIDPASEFTLKVKVAGDVNAFTFDMNVISDNYIGEWDAIRLESIDGNSGNSNGCEVQNDYYCLKILSTDWNTKFISGTSEISLFVTAKNYPDVTDSNATTHDAITVNSLSAISSDASSGSYSGNPEDQNVSLVSSLTNSYITLTHTGNITQDTDVNCTDLEKGIDSINKSNEKFSNSDDVLNSTICDGTPQTFLTDWARGTYPTSSSQNQYWWLSFPSLLASGSYEGNLIYNSEVS